MNAEPRISVVLASYNGSRYIEEQIRSLLEQLGQEDEIVVSDDASTDETVAVVSAIADHRVSLLRATRQVGYQKNFERAIRAARGRFVLFSDQDDHCLPLRVPASLDALERNSFVCGDATVVNDSMQVLHQSYFTYRRARNFKPLEILLKPPVIGATMACRREFLLSALPFPAAVPHDQWLSLLAALRGELAVVHHPFILYRRHDSAASLTGVTHRRRSIASITAERVKLLAALVRHWIGTHSSRPPHA